MNAIAYYRDLRAYGDGTHLYVSASGIVKSWSRVGPAYAAYVTLRLKPDLVIEHWGGAASGPLKLYRRDRVRHRLGPPYRGYMRALCQEPWAMLEAWALEDSEHG